MTKLTAISVIKQANIFFGVDVLHISNSPKYSHARFLVMKYLRDEKLLTFEQIARIIGCKDHANVMHGVDRVNKDVFLKTTYKAFRDFLEC